MDSVLPYPGSRIGIAELIIFSEKNDSAYANFREYSSIYFYFQCKIFFVEKNNFLKISALFFWNYFIPNLLVGYGIVPLTGFSLNPDSLDWQIYGESSPSQFNYSSKFEHHCYWAKIWSCNYTGMGGLQNSPEGLDLVKTCSLMVLLWSKCLILKVWW